MPFFVTHVSYGKGLVMEPAPEEMDTRKRAAEFFGCDEEHVKLAKKTRDGSLFVGLRTGMAYYVTEGTAYYQRMFPKEAR